ncbi:hypothetical protein [Streptomyces sp. NPDC086182]|jgi:hypothetical protein|uniref:hypothetical protein n=1 Tax=Streptomyces sp. NPDC086182 TaxID=3155058 RepID=UPI0034462847
MPTQNPYASDDNNAMFGSGLDAWEQGYEIAISSPPVVPETPLSRNPVCNTAWTEGALAGNADGRSDGWRLRLSDTGSGIVPENWPDVVGAESGGPDEEAMGFPKRFKGVGYLPLTLMLSSIAPDTEDGKSRTAPEQVTSLATVCGDKKYPSLYLPLYAYRSEGPPRSDFWHGEATASFGEAAHKLKENFSNSRFIDPQTPALIRYLPGSEHYFWDWLPLGSAY